MSEYTKGKWKYVLEDGEMFIYADTPEANKTIGQVYMRTDFIDCPTGEANAKLIAAAPDLLAACKLGLQIAKWTANVRNAPSQLTKDIKTIEDVIAKTEPN